MELEVLTPEKPIYSGQVKAVTVPGINGRFQILENHAPIVSALTQGRIEIETAEGEMTAFAIDRGFIEVLRNVVSLLVHIPAEEEDTAEI